MHKRVGRVGIVNFIIMEVRITVVMVVGGAHFGIETVSSVCIASFGCCRMMREPEKTARHHRGACVSMVVVHSDEVEADEMSGLC